MNKYSVNEWGSHPDAGNDDCWTGEDFDTLEEAEAAFAAEPRDGSTVFVELDGPGTRRIREIQGAARRVARELAPDPGDCENILTAHRLVSDGEAR